MEHASVLLKETVDLLNVKPDGIYIDGTLGRGGHAKEVLKQLTTGHLYAFDKDEQALAESAVNLAEYADRVTSGIRCETCGRRHDGPRCFEPAVRQSLARLLLSV